MKGQPALKAQAVCPRFQLVSKRAASIDIGSDSKAFLINERERINQVLEAFFWYETADGENPIRFNPRAVRAEPLQVGAVIEDVDSIPFGGSTGKGLRQDAFEVRRVKACACDDKRGGARPDPQIAR